MKVFTENFRLSNFIHDNNWKFPLGIHSIVSMNRKISGWKVNTTNITCISIITTLYVLQVASLFNDASLGNSVKMLVTRLVILTEDQVIVESSSSRKWYFLWLKIRLTIPFQSCLIQGFYDTWSLILHTHSGNMSKLQFEAFCMTLV